MTLSRNSRLENMDLALVTMNNLLGERPMLAKYFSPEQAEFVAVYETTWKELEDRRLVHGSHTLSSGSSYRLTGLGWLRAISSTGEIETAEFKARLGCLSAALKALVKGRRQRSLTNPKTMAEQTGLPEWWIFNIVESRIWEKHLKRVGPDFDDSRSIIWVPIDFGMEPL
jgi:hypothetical protein